MLSVLVLTMLQVLLPLSSVLDSLSSTMPPIQERLEFLCDQIQVAGFETIADAMTALLNYTADHSDTRTKIHDDVTSFFEGPALSSLCHAVINHPQYEKHKKILCQRNGIQELATSVTRETVVQEIHALSQNPNMHIPISGYSQAKIDRFSIERLKNTHQAVAPVLWSILMAVVSPHQPKKSALELHDGLDNNDAMDISGSEFSADSMPAGQRDTQSRSQNRELTAISALSMLAYAHSKHSNLYQVIMGYHAFASGIKKHTMEAYHQTGYMISYESVTRVVRANAVAMAVLLKEKAQTHRFSLSLDNLNFYQSKRDQTFLNRGHLVNYIAGFVTVMKRGPHISHENVDHKMVNNLTFEDVMLDATDIRCHQETARAAACQILSKYLSSGPCAQNAGDPAESMVPKYPMWDPPLTNEGCSLRRPNILPLPTLVMPINTRLKSEALIIATIGLLEKYVDILGLSSDDLSTMKYLINADLMTVRNITSTVHVRQEEVHRENTFGWAEPVAGLFHIQMTALKMLYNVFWGKPKDTVSLSRFTNQLCRKIILENATDFHLCNQFFLLLVDGFWLALIASECDCNTLEELETYMAKEDWRAMLDRVASTYIDPYAVHSIRSGAEEKVRLQVGNEIATLCARHENLVARGQETELPIEYWIAKEAQMVEQRLPRERDEVRENALLFLNNGLLYREFHEACRGGFSGRVFKCLKHYAGMFHGSRNPNHGRECLDILAHMKYGWGREMMDSFARSCMVSPTGFEGRFHTFDKFNEHEIRELKAMLHPSSSPQYDESFRRDVAFNFTSLASAKIKVQQASRSINRDQQQAAADAADLRAIFDALMSSCVFREELGRTASKGFIDLIGCGTMNLASGVPINEYLCQARGNWDRGEAEGQSNADCTVDKDDWQANDGLISSED